MSGQKLGPTPVRTPPPTPKWRDVSLLMERVHHAILLGVFLYARPLAPSPKCVNGLPLDLVKGN